MRIIVFTTDTLPLPGFPTSGTALRTYGLIQGLRAHGHEVIVSVPRQALNGLQKSVTSANSSPHILDEIRRWSELAFDSSNQRKILTKVNPEVIICGHWPAMIMPLKPSQLLIIDLAGPHLLERHYQQAPNQDGAILGKISILASADYYIVSGPSQQRYFLSFLTRGNVRNPEARMIQITMPLNPELPAHTRNPQTSDNFPQFIFGGVFLPWQDPSHALTHLATTLEKRNQGGLTLIGGKHPNYDVKEGIYTKLFELLAQNTRIQRQPMLPLEQFIEALTTADVALDVMKWNLERQLAVTIRSTTYLWSGVPIIYNNYADIARLIERYDAGWTVPPEDSPALDQVFDEIYRDPARVREKSNNARQLAQAEFAWDKAVSPLLSLLSSPPIANRTEIDIIVDFPESADLFVCREHPLKQEFICRMNGLSKVECRVATHNREIKKPVTFSLFQVDQGKHSLLVKRVGDKSTLINNEWFSLETSPIQDSAGKKFILEICDESSASHEGISPWAVKSTPYPLVGLHYGTKHLKHMSLCLRTSCERSSNQQKGIQPMAQNG